MREGGAEALISQQPDPAAAAARLAGLRHVSADQPGLMRVAQGGAFRYLDAAGRVVAERGVVERIAALAIPPAWTEVWICPSANGHLQAVGRDARGRRQYRYHPRWRAVRDEAKYARMASFGQALPRIRAQVEADLARPGLPREKVLAAIVALLQATMMRVGNEEYARLNQSFGLTTLRNRHAKIAGQTVEFRFRGKSGVQHCVRVCDRRLARIVRQTRELPGQELFQYAGADGEPHAVDSADVNDYLRAIGGDDYTAKDFRTWYGTVLAALALCEAGPCASESEGKSAVARAIEAVAARLGNTPAICRKCYVHPGVIQAYMEGRLGEALRPTASVAEGLAPAEAALLAFLEAEPGGDGAGAKLKFGPRPKQLNA